MFKYACITLLFACGIPPLQKINAQPIIVRIWDEECLRCANDFRTAVAIINQHRQLITIDNRQVTVENVNEIQKELQVTFKSIGDKEGSAPLAKSSGTLELSLDLATDGHTDDEMVFASLHELGHVFGLPHQSRGVMCGPPVTENAACAHGDEIKALGSWEPTIAEFIEEL